MTNKEGIAMKFIDEIFIIDEIFAFEQDAKEKYETDIPNVSYWDSSEAFRQSMARSLHLPPQSLPWDYYYTYSVSLQDRQEILRHLGVPNSDIPTTMGLLLQSGTIAIINIINYLVHQKKKKICILQPAYFSVIPCCEMFSLEYGVEKIFFLNGKTVIPMERILSGEYDCVWITSPLFCTSRYFDINQIDGFVQLIKSEITLILDECLALPGKELIRSIPVVPNVFAIYSPHKAISMNGLKFAVIVCNSIYDDFLEQWVDIFSGALAGSNRDAVFHFLSSNYLDHCLPTYLSYIQNTYRATIEVVKKFDFATMLSNAEGHYVNIFTDKIIVKKNDLSAFMKSVIENSFASFLPGVLNGYDPQQGLCFRVNLTGNPIELPSAVGRLLTYLGSFCH